MTSIFGRDLFSPKNLIISGTVLTLLFAAIIIVFLLFKANTIQQFNQIQAAQHNNTVFFDINKQPFHVIRGEEDRKYVKMGKISRNLQMAVVAVEDARFFQHFGFDIIRIISVLFRAIKPELSIQGASTITQQLVKLTLLSPERTLSRKVRELFMAIALEMEFSKTRILEFYLNKVYLGHRNYGVENASLNYFHKSTANLSIAEAAFIAGLIKKPEGYSPFVNLKKARLRQILVMRRMRILNWISRQEYKQAINEHLIIRERKKSSLRIAPYFVNHILNQLKQKYGHNTIYGGGLRIYTTLHTELQRTMERVVRTRIDKPGSFEEIAGVSIDPKTGFVKALVGGVNFFKSEFNRVTQAKRQPGSAFKPILYATAITKGIKPNDVFRDEPTQYTRFFEEELEIYEPGNFSGEHAGPITTSYALRVSNNVVSVQILNRIGIRTLLQSSKRFGMKLPAERGLCLALGCGETTLLQLVNAYSVFANRGFRNIPVFVLRITDSRGKLLEKFQTQKEVQVLSVNQAFQMNKMLQDVVNYGTGRNAKINRQSGGKTGTSDQSRDAWYIGYTPDLVTGFWIGNDDNTPMDNEVGGKTPARLWQMYMKALPVPDIQRGFGVNENFEEYLICDNSGKLATPGCSHTAWYTLRKDDPPLEYCDLHDNIEQQVHVCTSSGKLATEYCPIEEVETKIYTSGSEPETPCDIHMESDQIKDDSISF